MNSLRLHGTADVQPLNFQRFAAGDDINSVMMSDLFRDQLLKADIARRSGLGMTALQWNIGRWVDPIKYMGDFKIIKG